MQADNQQNLETLISESEINNNSNKRFTQRHLWIVLTFVLLFSMAATVRFLTYDRYLPFIDYTDEAVYVGWGLHLRGVSDETPLIEFYGQLPPAYIWYNTLVQAIFDNFKSYSYVLPADYYPILRLSSVVMGILTSICIAALAWVASDWRGGLFSGLIWGLAPIIVEYNSLAIPDPSVYLFTALGLLSAALAWKQKKLYWLFISLICGIAVIYLKYWIVISVLPFLTVASVLFLNGHLRRKWGWLLVYASLAISSALYLIFVLNPSSELVKGTAYSATDLFFQAIDLSRITNNIEKALLPIGIPLFVIVTVAALFSWGIARQKTWQRINLNIVGMLLIYLVVGIPLSAAISNVTADGRMRHIFPIAIALYALWGIGIAQILMALDSWAKQNRQAILHFASPILALILVMSLMPNYLQGNYNLILGFQREHVVNRLRNWSDDNLLADGLVMHINQQADLDRVWNRLWGAYAGDNPFVWWTEDASLILNTSPEDYISRSIFYFITDEESLGDLLPEEEVTMREYIADNLFLIKTFEVDTTTIAGSQSYFYRMFPPQSETSIAFGDTIQLIGYDLSAQSLQAGETLRFRPYWMTNSFPVSSYSMFIHLHTENDLSPVAQVDAPPASPERPTNLWDDANEVYIGRYQELTIPTDLPSGEYLLSIGLYDYQTGVRLQTEMGDRFPIAVTIEN